MVNLLRPLVILSLLAGPASTSEPPERDAWRIEGFEWHERVAAPATIRVVNPCGDIRVRSAPADRAWVFGALQSHRDDPHAPVITPRVDGARLDIGVACEVASGAPAAWRRKRADVTVFAPSGARLELRTRHGLIDARRLDHSIDAVTGAGEVRIVTSGSVSAETRSGSIHAALLSGPTPPRAELRTATGEVRATVPHDSDPEFHLESRGELLSDFAAVVVGDEGGERIATHRAEGLRAGRIILISESGSVRLRRAPDPVLHTQREGGSREGS